MATMQNSMNVPQKLKMEQTYDPAIPLLGTDLKKIKTLVQKDICTPMFIEQLFTITKIWKDPRSPSIDEYSCVYVCMCMCIYITLHYIYIYVYRKLYV